MQNASDQQYGEKRGMDAVEFALGEGLSNQTNFGELQLVEAAKWLSAGRKSFGEGRLLAAGREFEKTGDGAGGPNTRSH